VVSHALADARLVPELVTPDAFPKLAGAKSKQLGGTNNVSGQIIGQRVKERYRTMRGYKRKASILKVSSLIGWTGMQPAAYDLGALV
jgi:hypothetical protein